MRPIHLGGILVLAALGVVRVCAADTAYLMVTGDSPPVNFAAVEIEAALRERGFEIRRDTTEFRNPPPGRLVVVSLWPATDILLLKSMIRKMKPVADDIAAEGFSLRRIGDAESAQFHVFAKDPGGAMYGGLELAEQIRTAGVAGVVDTDRNPRMRMRGTKFNLPLDLRTPSYSDMSDSAQANIDTVWDFEFWKAYLDKLAHDRYNFVSLWNLHPFPSMVKVPGFPDVALDDVWRSKGPFDEDYSTRTVDLLSPALLANTEVLRKLTIGQKIEFWRRVMQYAKDRNIDFYLVTWNIYTYGVSGKHGITDALDNPRTREYFRASVREMFRTYPLLAGIGLTAGENMGEVKMYSGGVDSFDAKENWLFATYGQGVLEAAKAEPTRPFRLIHRQHESRAQDIAATFGPVIAQPNVDFVFSFKYAQAHALSSTTQSFHRGYLESLGGHRTLWTIRNDDALLFRWAAPDFVREFVRNIPVEKTQGFYFGSDMWVWGREFLSKLPGTQRQLEVEKHWLHFLLWGRLGYDPDLDNRRIAQLVELRFPGVVGAKVLAAWQNASMIYPLVTGFHWANFDFQWYIEACRSRPGPAKTTSGFHSVETFITQPVHPDTDNVPIPAYVAGTLQGEPPRGTTPFEIADRIDAHADAALQGLQSFTRNSRVNDAEYLMTFNDILLMAQLGKYYAAKIRGATELALYRATRDPQHQQRAVRHLDDATSSWVSMTVRMSPLYKDRFWTNRVGHVDWSELAAEVRKDAEIARAALP